MLLEALPLDIQYYIFSFLDAATLKNTALVSKSFYKSTYLTQWKLLASFEEKEQLSYLFQYCLKIDQFTLEQKNTLIECLEKYINTSNIQVSTEATALTLLIALFNKSATSPSKMIKYYSSLSASLQKLYKDNSVLAELLAAFLQKSK